MNLAGIEAGYEALNTSDKTSFRDFINANLETLAGTVRNYNALNASDKVLAFKTFCYNRREKAKYYNITFKQ